MSLVCGRKPDYLRETTQAPGEHADSKQKGPRWESNLRPSGWEVTKLTTVRPSLWKTKCSDWEKKTKTEPTADVPPKHAAAWLVATTTIINRCRPKKTPKYFFGLIHEQKYHDLSQNLNSSTNLPSCTLTGRLSFPLCTCYFFDCHVKVGCLYRHLLTNQVYFIHYNHPYGGSAPNLLFFIFFVLDELWEDLHGEGKQSGDAGCHSDRHLLHLPLLPSEGTRSSLGAFFP